MSYKYFDNEHVVYFDVDETLVRWNVTQSNELVAFKDPHDDENTYQLKPHKRHIKLLKDFHARGYVVVVWSAGGSKWANEVVRTLGIEQYVNLVISKPSKYVDDLKAQDFMGNHIYLEDK